MTLILYYNFESQLHNRPAGTFLMAQTVHNLWSLWVRAKIDSFPRWKQLEVTKHSVEIKEVIAILNKNSYDSSIVSKAAHFIYLKFSEESLFRLALENISNQLIILE